MNLEQPVGGVALLCDLGGNVLQVIRDELGFLKKQILGRPLSSLVDRGSLGKSLNFIVEIKSNGAAFDWELAVPLADGITMLNFSGAITKEKLLIVAAKTRAEAEQFLEELMRIGNEQVNALRAALKDRSDLVRRGADRDVALYDELGRLNNELANLQRELSKKNAELERLNEQKNHFLGIAAHDLRNPLNAIQMYSEFLLEESSSVLDQEHLEFVSIIHASSEFMLRLVNDLLDVAKIESGKLQLDLDLTDLASLMEHNVAVNRALAARKGVEVQFRSNEMRLEILIDGAKIEQVLNNLITNAVKFSPSGSVIEVLLAKSENNAVISVRDQGPGIPVAELDNLFKPFQRTSVKATAGEQSTGLGLAIARRIVLGHQGKVWVESEVGKGSTFYVLLPIETHTEPERSLKTAFP
jgi:signal transduction histidine kinase